MRREVETIPTGWEVRRLKFAATCNDETLLETTDPDFEMAYVDISSVDLVNGITAVEVQTFEKAPSRARRIVRDGDTLISTVRTYLKAIAPVEAPPENMIVSTGFAVVRPLEFIDSGFLGYALQNTAFIDAVVANSTGVSYPAINPTTLICLPVCYPKDKKEQQQIAAFLDWKTGQIDALIAKKKDLMGKLKEKRLAVITQAVTKGLNPAAPLRDSGISWLGYVPVHWEVKRLRFLLRDRFSNGLFKKAEFWGDGVRIVNVTDIYVHNDLVDQTQLGRLECNSDELHAYSANHGDFFVVRSSLKLEGVGKSAVLLHPAEPTVFECHIVRGRPDLNNVHPRFLNLFLNSPSARAYFNIHANVVTMATIDQEGIKNLFVSLPSYAEQEEIANYLDRQLERTDAMSAATKAATETLTEYRTALITAATTGKIDVRQFDIPSPSVQTTSTPSPSIDSIACTA